MPRSVVFAVLLDEELMATEELETAIDELDEDKLELLLATDELDTFVEELDFVLELLVAAKDDLALELLVATDELVFTLELDFTLELAIEALLDDEIPAPVVGIEHSFALLLGIGSAPKVATLQLKDPFNTL
jgi:hypothetical protein